MHLLDATRPTAVPAIAFLVWWPLFALLPGRFTRTFFIIAGVLTLAVVEGPWLALGLLAAILAGYALVEGVVRLPRGRRLAFAALMLFLHAAYWACFYLPLPDIFLRSDKLREADKHPAFVLFGGIAVTFFRLVSYAWDRWRGTGGPARLRDYLAYMLFFPQFRHGPVERCGSFAEKLRAARQVWTRRDLGVGLLRVAVALASLVGLMAAAQGAGNVMPAPLTNVGMDILSHPEQLTAGQVLLLMHVPLLILYVLESSFARLQLGVARAFGVRGTENFNYPLLARSPRELWHRWNITVSSWLRDYAYIPLGGNRRHKYLNIALVFVYCGLLHALQWRCLAWGIWTGGTLALFLWSADRWKAWRANAPAAHPVAGAIGGFVARLLTYHWLCIGVTIILDPEYCGLKVLARYLEIITGGLVSW